MLPDVAAGTAARSVTAIEKSPAAGPPSGSVAATESVTFVRCFNVPRTCISVVASSSPRLKTRRSESALPALSSSRICSTPPGSLSRLKISDGRSSFHSRK